MGWFSSEAEQSEGGKTTFGENFGTNRLNWVLAPQHPLRPIPFYQVSVHFLVIGHDGARDMVIVITTAPPTLARKSNDTVST
jgi:hypothetical protein